MEATASPKSSAAADRREDRERFESFVKDWEHRLRTDGKAHKTILIYGGAARALGDFLAETDRPLGVRAIGGKDVDAYINHLRQVGRSASTVHQHAKSLDLFFRWLAAEDELPADRLPTRSIKVPQPEPAPPDVLTEEETRKLVAACQIGPSKFANRRDEAIVRMFEGSGMRLAELAGLRVEDVEIDGDRPHANVTGKGAGRGPRARTVAISPEAANAVRRYRRERALHEQSAQPELWLGTGYGKKDDPRRLRDVDDASLAASGIGQIIARRGQQAGVSVHPHQVRHTFAHRWLARGGSEGGLMKQMGWHDRSMLDRYGASAASDRSLDEYQRLFGKKR